MSPLVAALGLTSIGNRQGVGASSNTRSTPIPLTHNLLNNNRGWSASCLRPAPPLRPCLALGTTPSGSPIRSTRKPVSYKEDALILDVIEAYCSNGKPRNTVNSVEVHSTTDGLSAESDKNTADSVKALTNRVKNLEINLATLSSQLTEERSARCALQTIVKNHGVLSSKDFDSIEWPTMESNI